MPRCPSCDEKVSAQDDECPHCGEELRASASERGPKKGKKKNKSDSSVLVILLVAIGGGVLMCGGILAALAIPAFSQAREAARRAQCMNNLKQIGLALHNYHDNYKVFPAAHLNDSQGQPKLSWRVSILPYLDEAPRFQRYVFDETWDGPSNSQLLNPMPVTYACPAFQVKGPNTCYATITGENTVLGAGQCISIVQVLDGTSNTLMVVEACQTNIPWMKPQDLDAKSNPRIGDPNGLSSNHAQGVNVLMTDGSVRRMSKETDPVTIQQLTTRNGGEAVDF